VFFNAGLKLGGSPREVVDGYASACAHSPLLCMLPSEWRLLVLFGERGVRVAFGVGLKRIFLGMVTRGG